MIHKAIQRAQKPLVLFLSIAGAVIGLSLLMITTQVYTDMNDIKNGNSDGDQFLVITKKVGLGNTMGISTSFTENEMADIKSQPFVKDLSGFTSAKDFKIYVSSTLSNGKSGGSLGYFESVPAKFVDTKVDDWTWKNGDVIPVIMPTVFLMAYNFGISETMNTPKVSKGTIGLIPITVSVDGNGKQAKFEAQIVGFSDRINSALVPIEYLNEMNSIYGSGEAKESNKIIISTTDAKNPKLASYLSSKGYETNMEQLRGPIIEKMIKPILTFTGILCLIIIVLTLFIYLLYGEIIILKSKYDIHVLSLLGYRWKDIAMVFNIYFLIIYGVIAVISISIFFVAKYFIDAFIEETLFYSEQPFIAWETLVAVLLFLGLFISINILSTRRQIISIAKN
jgi:hypothetical protein